MTGQDPPLASTPVWCVRGRELRLNGPLVMGVVNVTPDSFSDGGLFLSVDAAAAHADRLVAEGADILDVGGESTRPQGAVPVSAREELDRVLPVLGELRRRHPHLPLSIDTNKAAVAAAALAEGVQIVNDVSGLRLDPQMGAVVARANAGVVLMHSRGGVSDMATYTHASYADGVVPMVVRELREAIARGREAGVRADAIAVDPGIGFSKTGAQSLEVLRHLDEIARLRHPLVIGVSRKRFLGEITGVQRPADRVQATIAACVMALTRGARIFRVHDVGAARQALDVAWRIANGDG